MMPIAEEQAKFMAAYLAGHYHPPAPAAMAEAMRREHEAIKSRFTASKRHTIEIDCQEYTYNLWRELKAGARRAAKAGHRLPVPPH